MITLGTDPEFFLYDKNIGRIKSAIGLVGGSKYEPRELGDGYKVQEDNVLVEFNIPPCETSADFVFHINEAKKRIQAILPEECEIVCKASHSMNIQEINHPQAMEFGCDPDFNCWTQKMNPKPKPVGTLRSAGGHIHVGFSSSIDSSFLVRCVKFMDMYLGIPSVLIDKDSLRKELYGKAGAFRVQPYGFEYRTLSNFWLENDNLITWAFENTKKAIEAAASYSLNVDEFSQRIQNAINNNDAKTAKELIEQFNIPCYEENFEYQQTVIY